MTTKLLLSASLSFLALTGAAQAATIGDITPKPGAAGCIAVNADDGCTVGRNMSYTIESVFSPDGTHVYSGSANGINIFDRAPDGTLTQKPGVQGCVQDELDTGCAIAEGLQTGYGLAISPDGKNLYVTSGNTEAVIIFDIAADGTVDRKAGNAGCVADFGQASCTNVRGLHNVVNVVVSPDGKQLYTGAQTGDGIGVFDRAADGTLTQKAGAAGCLNEPADDGCGPARQLKSPSGFAFSADGANLYTTDDNGIAVFDRAADGTLTQKAGTAGCINESGLKGCALGHGLFTAQGIAISPTGTHAYAASQTDHAILTFDRAANGVLTQRAGAAGCLAGATSSDPECSKTGRGMEGPKQILMSADGANLYAATQNVGGVVAFDVAADGSVSQKPGAAGCLASIDVPTCGKRGGMEGAAGTSISPDGRSVLIGASTGNGLHIFDRALASDPGVTPADPAGPGTTPGPGGNPVTPVALCNGPLTLLDVLPSGRSKVRLTGLARSQFAGETVVLREGSKRVGTAKVAADGRFSAVVKAPSAKRRAKAKYTAALPNGTRSSAFKLKRAFTIVSRKNVKGGIKIVVQLKGTGRSREVRVQRQTTCTERRTLATRTIDKKGRLTVTLPRPTEATDPVAIYRVRARIKKQLSFTLQIAVERAR